MSTAFAGSALNWNCLLDIRIGSVFVPDFCLAPREALPHGSVLTP